MREPIFLVGAERSGMLLMELMLGAHPDIVWGGEFDYALDWEAQEYADWPPLIPYWRHLAFSPVVRQLRLKVDPTLSFPELLWSLLDQQRARAEGRQVGVTVHDHFDRLLRLWPHGRFIYLKRGVPADADAEERRLRESDRLWRRIAGEIPMQRRLEIRYESLIAFPRLELERACQFLGVEYDASMLGRPHVALGEDGAFARVESGLHPASQDIPRASAPRRLARFLGRRAAFTRSLLGD